MKYIVELKPEYEDSFKGLMVLGAKDNNLFVDVLAVDDLEELDYDHINENLERLQDDAYQRGLEDGKAQSEKGCEGCRYESRTSEEKPCVDCSKNFKNHWRAKQTDEIKVGDEMRQVCESGAETGVRCIVTAIDSDCMSGFSQYGRAIVCSSHVNRWWKKTGRHFDIDKILEEMKE